MPILANTTALTVYHCPAFSLDLLTADAALQRHAFRSIDQGDDPLSVGWVNVDDMADTRWELSSPDKGRFLTFALRVDERKIPAPVLKRHLKEALDDHMAQEGKDFLSKGRKAEIKEQVLLRLMARAMPVPKTVDVLWDQATGQVLLFAATERMRMIFEDLFKSTFGAVLEQGALDTAEGLPVGPQFLTWLWQREAAEFIGRVTVSSGAGEGLESITGDGPNVDTLREIVTALESGRLITKAKIRLTDPNNDGADSYEMTLDLHGNVTGFRTPRVDTRREEGDDPDAVFLEKVYLVQQGLELLQGLFRQFLATTDGQADAFADVRKLAQDPGVQKAVQNLRKTFQDSGADSVTFEVPGMEPITVFEKAPEATA